MIRILFICHGNICRSVAGEMVLRQKAEEQGITWLRVDSAATTREEIGNDIYPPMKKALQLAGYVCHAHAARQTLRSDYASWDYIIGMDWENMDDLFRIYGGDPSRKLSLLMDWTGKSGQEVEDPWYSRNFRGVLQQIEEGCDGLIQHLRIRREKQALRRQAKRWVERMTPEEREAAGARIADEVLESVEYRAASVIMAYVSTPTEPDTRRILEDALARGKTVLLPKCLDGQRMEARSFGGWDHLVPGRWGIPEPREQAEKGPLPQPELILVPCVAASRNGTRLGHGAGYYDRFLAGQPGRRWCLCFEACLHEEIPTEAGDLPMDRVITELG